MTVRLPDGSNPYTLEVYPAGWLRGRRVGLSMRGRLRVGVYLRPADARRLARLLVEAARVEEQA